MYKGEIHGTPSIQFASLYSRHAIAGHVMRMMWDMLVHRTTEVALVINDKI